MPSDRAVMPDRQLFATAVAIYGIATVFAALLWRRGFRRDNQALYLVLLTGLAFHTAAMVRRGFSLNQCPIHNLFEAVMFIAWTTLATCLAIGWFQRLRFLGAFAAPVLFGIGTFALMPGLDDPESARSADSAWISLHAALVLLGYGAFGLSALASLMYLVQEHDLRFRKARAVAAFLPPIQRLESVSRHALECGVAFLTLGLAAGALHLKSVRGSFITDDAFVLYCWFTWAVYAALLVAAAGFSQRGRRFAWGALGGFTFIMLTFWGVWMFSGLHNPRHPSNDRYARITHAPLPASHR